MDKSLKKLSRLELLELMVKLSEANDALVAENAELRQSLEAKPQMARNATVGSIAEYAMQTNRFFEAAQNAADDYLREIKRMRDQLAARAAAQGVATAAPVINQQVPDLREQAAAEAAMREARLQAQAVMKRANTQAESMLADARAKSDALIADANRQSRAIIARANRQADAVMNAAHGDVTRQRQAAISPSLSGPIRGRHARVAVGGA